MLTGESRHDVARHAGGSAAAAGPDRAALAGWTPDDLGEWVRRRLGPTHLPVLAEVLTARMARHPSDLVAARWRAEVRELGHLRPLPRRMPPPGQPQAVAERQTPASSGVDTRDQKLLARVRALLAKAESTDFPDEAEALSAKAQELISKHSLDALMERAAAADGSDAGRSRCSTVSSERAGFTTVVGAAHGLDAVELMTTSLMVQADAAMLAAGRQVDAWGRSRTASYRRAFLLAYATRIGQRLTEADRAATGAVRGADSPRGPGCTAAGAARAGRRRAARDVPDHRAPPGHDEQRGRLGGRHGGRRPGPAESEAGGSAVMHLGCEEAVDLRAWELRESVTLYDAAYVAVAEATALTSGDAGQPPGAGARASVRHADPDDVTGTTTQGTPDG